jgi:hypothetical protein
MHGPSKVLTARLCGIRHRILAHGGKAAMMKALLAAQLTLLLLLAPMPWGIALNHETKECGGFWSGDEYAGYRLPEGWVDYYPRQGVIETEVGSCSFPGTSGFESPNEARAKAAEACCQELGYTYVGAPIGKHRLSPLIWLGVGWFLAQVCAVCGIVILVAGLIGLIVWIAVALIRRQRRSQDRNRIPEP